jgi:ribosome-associated protein
MEAGKPEAPSKSEMKRRMHALQELGEAVCALPAERLAALAIEDRLRDAITELARTRSHEGRRRQLQYIGKLMKFEDAAALREAVAAWRLGGAREALALHEAESWRERLLADDDALAAWMNAHPQTDAQQLRSLVRAARKDAVQPEARHGRPYRELFQVVRQQLEAAAPDPEPEGAPVARAHEGTAS